MTAGPLDETQPVVCRTAYSRAELSAVMTDWLIELYGAPPLDLDPDERERWYRDNGLLNHFINSHFP